MPHTQLWILHPRAIVILFQSRPITKFLMLQLLPIIPILIFSIGGLHWLISYPRHREPKWIVMILLQHRPLLILYRKTVKENVPALGLIGHPYIKITISRHYYR